MSIVVKCDKCEKEIASDETRVILTATRYELYDPAQAQQPTVTASAPPGTVVPGASTPTAVPQRLPGSDREFVAMPAFEGQLEMHDNCWKEWIKQTG